MAQLTVEAEVVDPPAQPTSLTVVTSWEDADFFSVTARWAKPSGAERYEVRSGKDEGGWSYSEPSSDEYARFRAPVLTNSLFFLCVTAFNAGGASAETCTEYDVPAAPNQPDEPAYDPLSITTSSTLPSGTEGSYYGKVLAFTGGDGSDVSWTRTGGSLPSGISLSVNGTVTGTPIEAGDFSFTAQVSNGQESDSRTFSLSIEPVFTRDPGTPGSGDCPAAAGDAIKPDFCEDFSTYSSSAEIRSDPNGWFYWQGEQNIHLDRSVSPPGQTQSLRYTYHSRDDADHVTPKGRLGYLWDMMGGGKSDYQEVWIEVKHRFSSNFTMEGHDSYRTAPNPPASGLKLVHIHYYRLEDGFSGPNSFRLDFHNGDGGDLKAQQGGDNWDNQHFFDPNSIANNPKAMFDGRTWHVQRLHIRVGGNSRNLPHLMEWWMNGHHMGVSKAEHPGSGVPYINAVQIGANMNRYAPEDQHIWWAYVKIWKRDPGW
jgi:hypothetical protein